MGSGTDEETPRPLWRDLADVRFRTQLLPRLLPWLYGGLVAGWAYALGWLVLLTFERALWLGVLHLVVVAPVALGIGTMFIRALLEFGLAVMEIREHVVEFGELPRRLGSWPAMRRIVALGESRVWSVRREVRRD